MNEESLFAAALQKASATERRAFLDEACAGDSRLRRRLERLLAADAETRGVLDDGRDAAAVLGAYKPQPPLAAEQLFAGRFKLLRKLGEGGMGEVWLADQTEPVRRRVALKVIRPALGSDRLLARFEAERQALALMDHPNIGKVLDAGVADGRPFFVMELIEGVPITSYCDQARLPLRERLGLFVPVCQAVQHAHTKGVIHRDLKPPNILVTHYDGRPVPKVIDFGVAKATGPRLGGSGARTEVGTIVGTLEYMSPEQAEVNDLDVDTRSDVYALGVLLHELLTGGVPFPRERLRSVPLTEMLRIIREVEAPRPSARLSASETLPAVAAARRTGPRKLVSQVRGELDWIVMKCLDKERGRRYETADGLARDVVRYLADEPVEASPPSTAYRLKKFLRRHRGPVLAAAVIFLLLVGGIAGTTAGLKLASDRLAQLEAEKERADEEAGIARAVDDFVQKDLLGQADVGNQPGGARDRNVTVRELLDRAAGGLETRFGGRGRTEAAIRLTLGRAYQAVGEYAKAQKHLERSLALLEEKLGPGHRDTLESMQHLASLHHDRREYGKAELLYRQVLEARRAELGADHPDTLQTLSDIGVVYLDRGWYDRAEPLLKDVLEARRTTLGADRLDTLESTHNLARLCAARRHFHLAEPLFKRASRPRRDESARGEDPG
jgi:serine/threonine protein kinase